MTWSWRCLNAAGEPVEVEGTDGFPTQSDAESWLGEQWPDLLADGVDSVELYEDDRAVYGPMSLHPPD